MSAQFCQLGRPPMDAFPSVLNTNRFEKYCAYGKPSGVWCQVRNNQHSFTITAGDRGAYISVDTNASGPVFDLVEGDPVVSLTGVHNGQIEFLVGGTYQITLSASLYAAVDESGPNQISLVFVPTGTTPTTTTPNQAVRSADSVLPTTMQITYIVDITEGTTLDLFQSASLSEGIVTYEDFVVDIVRV